jgi:E3 ubiquitin-protein ligase TRIP12
MIKAKAKADRANARQVQSGSTSIPAAHPTTAVSPSPAYTSPVAQDTTAAESGSAEPQTQDGEEALPLPKEPTVDRTELLRSKPAVVGRFMQLMVPILVDVYAASVITPVRVKTLTGLLKAVSFLDGDGLKRVLTVGSFFKKL